MTAQETAGEPRNPIPLYTLQELRKACVLASLRVQKAHGAVVPEMPLEEMIDAIVAQVVRERK